MKINNDIIMGLDISEETHFSWSGCDNCNNGLGNTVYDVEAHFETGNDENRFDYYEIKLCPGCVNTWHNAEPLPEECNNVYNI